MVRVKNMNESLFSRLQKELTVAGELIRARQEEKQGLLDEFEAEAKRFFFGKISERSLESSVKKTNKELMRLDKEIRNAISRVRKVSDRAAKLASAQAPIKYKATLSGTVGGKSSKGKKTAKRKMAKKKKAKKVAKKTTKKKKK